MINTELIQPYSVNKTCIYQFITKTGSEYKISFEDGTEMSGLPDPAPCRLMYLSLKKEGKANDRDDKRTSEAIISSILDYVQGSGEVITYTFSNRDGKAKARERLFLKWFNDNNPGDFVCEPHPVRNEKAIFIYSLSNESAKHLITLLEHLAPK